MVLAPLLTISEGWQEAASKIAFAKSMQFAIDLTQEQYADLHDGRRVEGLDYDGKEEFLIDRVGHEDQRHFQDLGIEYYRYVS